MTTHCMDIWDYDIIKIKNRNAISGHVPGTIGLRLSLLCRNHDTTGKHVLQAKCCKMCAKSIQKGIKVSVLNPWFRAEAAVNLPGKEGFCLWKTPPRHPGRTSSAPTIESMQPTTGAIHRTSGAQTICGTMSGN